MQIVKKTSSEGRAIIKADLWCTKVTALWIIYFFSAYVEKGASMEMVQPYF